MNESMRFVKWESIPVKGFPQYEPRGKFSRWLLNLLERIGLVKFYFQETKIHTGVIHYEDIDQYLGDQIREIFYMTGKVPKYAIIGHDAMTRLLKSDSFFYGGVPFNAPRDSKYNYWNGIKLIFLPWWEGCVVVPEI